MSTLRLTFAVGTVFSLLLFSRPSRADVIVSNLPPDVSTGTYYNSGTPFGQVFTMPGTAGTISGLTVSLQNNSTSDLVTFYLYNVSSGVPTTSVATLGSFNTTSSGLDEIYTLTLDANPTLEANTSYAVVMSDPSENANWDTTTFGVSSSGGSGTLGYRYNDNSGTWQQIDTTHFFQMELQTTPAPESSVNIFMGLGGLIFAAGRISRRKLARSRAS